MNQGYITDLNGISKDYRGSRIEGTLLSFEMLIIAMAMHFIYRSEDLKHWEHKQQYLWEIQPIRRVTAFTDMEEYNDSHPIEEIEIDKYSEMRCSELSGVSAYSINNPPSSLLTGRNKKHDTKPLLLTMPEDHSLHDESIMRGTGYQSLDDKR